MKTVLGTFGVATILLFAFANGAKGEEAPACANGPGDAVSSGAAALADAFRQAAEKAAPSVVTIETYGGPRETIEWTRKSAGLKPHDDAQDFAGLGNIGARNGIGTGIIYDWRGYGLTCNHVIADSDTVFVRLADGRRFEAVKIYRDPFSDIAVIQICGAGKLPAAELCADDKLSVGDWVITIGNPYGLGISVSAGVVSAKDRHMQHIPHSALIQTDAATNPGNSGGALVDLTGRVVGVSEGGYGVVEGFQGIGFAIPIKVARRIADELIANGRVTRPFLGIETENISADIAKHLGLKSSSGVIVSDLAPRSPAAQAGVRVSDVLTHYEGLEVSDNFELLRRIDETSEGESISLIVFRNSESIAIELVPTSLPIPAGFPDKSEDQETKRLGYYDTELGLAVDESNSETAKELGYKGPLDGLLVTYVKAHSIAAKQGICAGMSLVRVDGELVKSVDDYRKMIQTRELAKGTLLLIDTADQKHFVLCRK